MYDCIAGGDGVHATLSWAFEYSSGAKQRPTKMTYSAQYSGDADAAACASTSRSFPNE